MPSQFLVAPESARRAFAALRKSRIHPHFAGYLAINREIRGGQTAGSSRGIKAFFEDFLTATGLGVEKPYVFPFDEAGGLGTKNTFNRNVAGSYAPSSLRDVAPFLQVVKIEERSRARPLYVLREGHVDLAFKHLIYRARVSPVALASFLYRDYGITADSPDAALLVEIFRDEFGFSTDTAFSTLFNAADGFSEPEWLLVAQEAD
jgi:hypothetical protein